MTVPEHIRQKRHEEQQKTQLSPIKKLDGFFGRRDTAGWLTALLFILLFLFGVPAVYYVVFVVY